MEKILNEVAFVQKVLKEPIYINEDTYNILRLLARYYSQTCGLEPAIVKDRLSQCMAKLYYNYDVTYWESKITKIATCTYKGNILQLDYIPITENEIKKINKLRTAVLRKVAFTLLCLAKYYNAKNTDNRNWTNSTYKEIFELANVRTTGVSQSKYLHNLYKAGYILPTKKIDNLNMKVKFIDDTSPIVLKVKSIKNLGYEYEYFIDTQSGVESKYIKCKNCGVTIKSDKNRRREYCDSCSQYTPIKYRSVPCIDCGEFFVTTSVSHRLRCSNCKKRLKRKYDSNRYQNNK